MRLLQILSFSQNGQQRLPGLKCETKRNPNRQHWTAMRELRVTQGNSARVPVRAMADGEHLSSRNYVSPAKASPFVDFVLVLHRQTCCRVYCSAFGKLQRPVANVYSSRVISVLVWPTTRTTSGLAVTGFILSPCPWIFRKDMALQQQRCRAETVLNTKQGLRAIVWLFHLLTASSSALCLHQFVEFLLHFWCVCEIVI